MGCDCAVHKLYIDQPVKRLSVLQARGLQYLGLQKEMARKKHAMEWGSTGIRAFTLPGHLLGPLCLTCFFPLTSPRSLVSG